MPRRGSGSMSSRPLRIGLVLVVLGVYSLIAYTVSRQTREIGIRIAIGAGRTDVLRMTIGMGIRWLATGVAIGMAASYATTRLLASQLFEVSPTDPLTFGAVLAVLAAAGLAASYIPARRATNVDRSWCFDTSEPKTISLRVVLRSAPSSPGAGRIAPAARPDPAGPA